MKGDAPRSAGSRKSYPVITYAELTRRMADPDTADDQVLPYLIEVPSTGTINPKFQPNPTRVTGLETGLEGGVVVELLNDWRRRQRQRAYRKRLADGWTGPRIISEGDSWFQYPTSLQDVIDHLMRDHAILCVSAAGDTLADMRDQNEVISNIARENASAVLFSAGGNDLFQDGNIGTLIEPVFSGAKPSDLLGATFDAFMARIASDYRAYLLRVHVAHPSVHILMHGYGPAFSRNGAWIGRPLKKKGVLPVSVQNALIKLVLRRFNAELKALAADPVFHGKVAHIDVTDIGQSPDDWYDEIHLNGENFGKVASRFRAELKKRLKGGLEGGLESGVEAVGAETEAEAPALAAIAEHAGRLMALDAPLLEAELERRLRLLERDPSQGDRPSMELLIVADGGLESGLTSVGPLARRLLRRWERELYELICGTSDEDTKERRGMLDALKLGEPALIGAMTAWLATGPLAVPAVVAGVLAAILVKRIGGSAQDELCKAWKERLDAAT
jgi:GDSL-like Lipase/Acylhydrolase family